jgi:hypothetical protein
MTTTTAVKHVSTGAVSVVSPASGSIVATVTAGAGNGSTVYIGTNAGVCIYPWLGTALNSGQTAIIGVMAGQTLYSHSPGGPAALTVTY